MAPINEVVALKEAIVLLKTKQVQELTAIKTQLDLAYQSFSPSKFIKNALHDAVALPEVKNGFIDTLIGLTTGYLSKKMLIGSSNNPLKNMIGMVLEFTVANFTAKHTFIIKKVSSLLVNRILNKSKKQTQ
jgi:hypothetical protein